MQPGILKAPYPFILQRSNAKYAQHEKTQSNADQNQHNWRWPTHAASRGGTVRISGAFSPLGPRGIVFTSSASGPR